MTFLISQSCTLSPSLFLPLSLFHLFLLCTDTHTTTHAQTHTPHTTQKRHPHTHTHMNGFTVHDPKRLQMLQCHIKLELKVIHVGRIDFTLRFNYQSTRTSLVI